MNTEFPLNTVHYHNTYTTNENSLAVSVVDQAKFIDIARQQTSKWSPNTLLATTEPPVSSELTSSGDDGTTTGSTQPNLDIDSTHIIATETTLYDFDINSSSKFHANSATPTSPSNLASSDDAMGDIDGSSSDLAPTEDQIQHFNSHPLFDLLSPYDANYIKTISLQLATHKSTLDNARLNPYTSKIAREGYQRDALPLPTLQSESRHNPFPKSLSLFQSHGVAAILHNHHLLVTAHTGSGKTMAAHAIIAHTLALGGKVVYTAPIKALSNQKYAELSKIYPNVGLQTGDVTVNPDADVIVMTTEVLRNMSIHSRSPYAAAIFDEVHYMDDASRGVIWEETLLTLEESTQMVFLSASVENGDEFAQWISKVTKRPCHIVNTRVRAVPIAHILLPQVKVTMKDRGNLFGEYRRNFSQRQSNPNSTPTPPRAFPVGQFKHYVDFPNNDPPPQKDYSSMPADIALPQIISALITAIQNNWLPLISFSFARRDLDRFATEVHALGFCVTTPKQQQEIRDYCETHFEKDVPSRETIISQLQSGIGVHHSGQITRVREVVENLLEKSLIKILFASETFAVGINVPVRTVLFTTMCKFDGTSRRLLNPSEYTQMSGRAGRRGKDRVGISIVLEDRETTAAVYRSIVCGSSLCIESRFRVSVGLLLSSLMSTNHENNSGTSVVNVRGSSTIQSKNTTSESSAVDKLMESAVGNTQGYTLQKVIENSFAIYRFSRNKASIATAMLSRGLLLFAQLVDTLYRSTRKNPAQLDRFKPWINIEEAWNQIGAETMKTISQMRLVTFSVLSLALDDDHCLALDPTINMRVIASALITPPLFFPIYVQSLQIIIAQGQTPVSTQDSLGLQHHEVAISQLMSTGRQHSPFAFRDIYHTVLSIIHPFANDLLSFEAASVAGKKLEQHEQDQEQEENKNGQNDQQSFLYGSPLDTLSLDKPTIKSTAHLMGQEADPNDVVNYCVPGRVVYIEFPAQFHSPDYSNAQSRQYEGVLNGQSGIKLPNVIGWGIVVGIKMQYALSVFVDVLVALPLTDGSYDLHAISVCECSISQISQVILPLPSKFNLEDEPARHALWISLHQASSAWTKFLSSSSQQATHPDGTKTTGPQYHIPQGISANMDVNDFSQCLVHFDTQELISATNSKFPLIFSRASIPSACHTETLHRTICTLVNPPKKTATQIALKKKQSQSSSITKKSGQTFSHSGNYLAGVLSRTLSTYPPPLRTMISLILDSQACWLSHRLDSFKHIIDLATTSYNNTLATEGKGGTLGEREGQDEEGDEEDEDDEEEKEMQDEETRQRRLQLSQAEDQRKSSIQTIVSKYLSTVSTMTKYMALKDFIKPREQLKTSNKSPEESLKALLHSTTKDISELISDFHPQVKGKVCSFIDSPNAVVLTELLFNNTFLELKPDQLAAVLSIFVTGSRESDSTPSFAATEPQIKAIYDTILDECNKLQELTDSVNPQPQSQPQPGKKQATTSSLLFDTRELGLEMVMPVLVWCRTHNIQQSLDAGPATANIFPGNLARTLSRILNLLAQIQEATKTIGDDQLLDALTQAEKLIHRGTLFVSSLHLIEIEEQRKRELEAKKHH